ncbi:MAG: efflux RND transporter permease subunit [Bacteroidia bacterium]|nr:efflux RND transporter permease subunit [Bacteroidia bacterium]
MKDNPLKEFFLSSWSIDNRTSVFVISILVTLYGIFSYIKLPKENFPEIVVPTIYVSTIYPGASPSDIENLVSKPIEKEIKSISGVKKLTSTSIQDYCMVMVEFNTDMSVAEAKQKVKDAVDKARPELPTDLPKEPSVMEVDFSEMPIMYINISGDFDLKKLKEYAELIQDRVESMKEITRVDIVGALDREIQINVDKNKMEAANITLRDLEMAIAYENMTISGGNIKDNGATRSISVKGDFKSVEDIANITLRSMSGATIYLKDIAEVKDGFKEKESYARLAHKNVITLNVVKRSGENLIEASDKIQEILKDLETNHFPKDLKITVTGDQSNRTRITLHDLINTIIIGFILVTLVLMFFMGTTNAIFVAMSVPLSMCLAFMVLPSIGFTMNMMVLFSFLLALGIVVDDAIVVIENTHRLFENGKNDIVWAAKHATGEVFLPVLSGTFTTLAPFIPLAFWGGIMGKFMFFLPVTLIITLVASLIVAYTINPVFAVLFMKPHTEDHEHDAQEKDRRRKSFLVTTIFFGLVAGGLYLKGSFGGGNFAVTMYLLFLLNKYVLTGIITKFQNVLWPKFQNAYENFVGWALRGWHPVFLMVFTIFLLIFSVVITVVRQPKVVFFPKADPNFIYVYVNLPIGTDVAYTDSITQLVEERVYKVVGDTNPMVESIISNVAIGATDPQDNDRSTAPQKGKVSVAFVEFAKRNGQSTAVYLDKIREAVKGIPGAEITVDQERNGPPVGKPVSIEISGDDFVQLIKTSKSLKKYLDSLKISGVEELKTDLEDKKPEMVVVIDRERANREGISTAQIGGELRNAIYGKEVSKFKDNNDEYPIMVRYQKDQRDNIDRLMQLKITYRDFNMGGMIRQIPLSSVASVKYENSYGSIRRKNQKRVITLGSNVLANANPNEVVAAVQAAIDNYQLPPDVTVSMTGEQEQQQETAGFLFQALLISIAIIVITLVTQFNSLSKMVLIISEIFLSIIGVLLGFAIFGMDISILMTGVGIVALAGIVVRNGILLVEFTDHLMSQGYELKPAIIEAGKTRMTPVLLTATATILGLIPLAVGLNIDFVTLFTEFNPHIFLGGDSVAFWGPLCWTMIFGLAFATFLTLILVPVMYLLAAQFKAWVMPKARKLLAIE